MSFAALMAFNKRSPQNPVEIPGYLKVFRDFSEIADCRNAAPLPPMDDILFDRSAPGVHPDQLLSFTKSCPEELRIDLAELAGAGIFAGAKFGERFLRCVGVLGWIGFSREGGWESHHPRSVARGRK
jgi:hypothetical protein